MPKKRGVLTTDTSVEKEGVRKAQLFTGGSKSTPFHLSKLLYNIFNRCIVALLNISKY